MPWIFSYCDFGPDEIKGVLPCAPFCSLAATLDGHTISFKGKSRKWGGALATVDKKRGRKVYGSAHLIPVSEVSLIDKYYKAYDKKLLPISISATGDTYKAYVYFLAKDAPFAKPSDDYTKVMLRHLRFFWSQPGQKPSFNEFGISIEPPEVKKEIKYKIIEKPMVETTTKARRGRPRKANKQ